MLCGYRARLVPDGSNGFEGPEKARADAAIAETKKTLRGIESRLRKGAATASAADAVLNQVQKDLASARSMVAKAAPVVPPPPAKAGAAGTATETPAAPEKWTCSYCDHVNKHDADPCANCGAARSKSK